MDCRAYELINELLHVGSLGIIARRTRAGIALSLSQSRHPVRDFRQLLSIIVYRAFIAFISIGANACASAHHGVAYLGMPRYRK